ncbi:MAG: DUF1440 domain-containing protein [Gemmatimonadetes bacterium]|nr:DUF1440 domain-containing protein [Gemmatimonadota bacterium]
MQYAHRPEHTLLRDALLGAAAGAAATWVMGKATAYLYEHEERAAREAEDDARGGKTAYGVAAEKAASAAGRALTEEERQSAGMAIHWALGVGAGALYGAMRGRVAGADVAAGLGFGAAFWLVIDEGTNALLGLTPPPGRFPLQTHVRGLAGHLVFGAATDAALRLADAVA